MKTTGILITSVRNNTSRTQHDPLNFPTVSGYNAIVKGAWLKV